MSRAKLQSAVALLLAFVTVAVLSTCTSSARMDYHQTLAANRVQAPEGSPVVLAAYQPWFGTKEHIDVGYSTQDPAIIERQIKQARTLGIEGFVVNWYGPRNEFTDKSYEVMQRQAAKFGFKLAIQYDEAVDNPGSWTDAVIVDLQYAYDKYIAGHTGLPTSSYLRYNGRPVIFIFGKTGKTDWNRVRQVANSWSDPPLLIFPDENSDYPNAFDGFYAWVQPGKKGWTRDGSNWGRDYLKDFYTRMNSKYPNKIAVGAAWPGFDDTVASWSQNRRMSYRCGKTFEDSLRLFRRFYNAQNRLPFLLIVTWNDYEEGTAIEKGLARCNGDRPAPATITTARETAK